MSWVGTAIAAGSAIFGAVNSADASRKAANTQKDAAQQAQDTQLAMFNQNKADLAPWMQGGQNANQAYLSFLGIGPGGSFNPNAPGVAPFDASMLPGDPSYKWRVQQGENALLNNASATGALGSGNTMKALVNYGQNAATQQYQQAFANYMAQQANVGNRLSGVSNTGVNAAGGIANLGAATAGNVAGLQQVQGAYGAANALGQAGAINQGVGGISNQWLYANALQQQGGGGGAAPQYMYNPAANPYDPNSINFGSSVG